MNGFHGLSPDLNRCSRRRSVVSLSPLVPTSAPPGGISGSSSRYQSGVSAVDLGRRDRHVVFMDIGVLGPLTAGGNGALSPHDRIVLGRMPFGSSSCVAKGAALTVGNASITRLSCPMRC